MGASIDQAVTKWIQKPVEFVEFHLVATYSFDELTKEEVKHIYNNPILRQACYIDLPLRKEKSAFHLDYYRKQTKKIQEEILKHPEWTLASWLKGIIDTYGEKDLYFSEDLGEISIYKGYDIVSKNLWVAGETCYFNGDDKLLLRALDIIDWKYGLKLPNTQIYRESLSMYPVGENEAFDEKILFDTKQHAPVLEEFLQTVQKQEDDDFFEERFKHWETLLTCLQQGAKFVYSV